MSAEKLAEIHALCFDVPRPWSMVEFKSLLKNPAVFLAQSSNGFALGRIAAPEAELLTIAVRPTAQGKGEGRELLSKIIESAQGLAVDELFLEVAETNRAAIGLYESTGFAKTGKRANYYQTKTGVKIAAIVMKMAIFNPTSHN